MINVCVGNCQLSLNIHSPFFPEIWTDTWPTWNRLSGRCLWPLTDAGEHRWRAWLLTRMPFFRSILSLRPTESFPFLRLCTHSALYVLLDRHWYCSAGIPPLPLKTVGSFRADPLPDPSLYPLSLWQFLSHVRAQKMFVKEGREGGMNKWKDTFLGNYNVKFCCFKTEWSK